MASGQEPGPPNILVNKRRHSPPDGRRLPAHLISQIGIIARNWVDSAQNRDYWRALVNAALNLRVS